MRRLQQPDDYGCVIACLSMCLDEPYSRVKSNLHAAITRNGAPDGIHSEIAAEYMFRAGYAMVRRYKFDGVANRERVDWPPRPFAPIHIAYVDATKGAHAVAMDELGRVFDPWTPERLTLAHPDYRAIHHVDGFFKVRT